MSKKFLLLTATFLSLLLGLVASPAFAQKITVGGGVKAGVNLANIHVDPEEQSDKKVGGVFGAFLNVGDENDILSFQPELLYSMKGAKFSDGSKVKVNVFEIPLLIRANLTKEGRARPFVTIGPAISFRKSIKGEDPSYIQQMILTSINAPIRIGRATVLPGDVVLAKKFGVIFIPAFLVEDLVLTSEFTKLRDEFGHQRLREKKYLAGQIDSQWSDEIKKDFLNWLNNYPGKLPMSKEELDNYLKERNY